VDHEIDAKFDQAIKRMSALPIMLEKLLSQGNEMEPSSNAWERSSRRRIGEAFSELEFVCQPWVIVRAS